MMRQDIDIKMVNFVQGLGSVCKSRFHVRREKALVDCGWESRPGTRFAPPGSNQSGGGGNEAVGASGGEGHL